MASRSSGGSLITRNRPTPASSMRWATPGWRTGTGRRSSPPKEPGRGPHREPARHARVGDDLGRGELDAPAPRRASASATRAATSTIRSGARLGRRVVGQLGAAADDGSLRRPQHRLALRIDRDREQHRQPVDVGEQARGTLRQLGRVERSPPVRRVDGDAPPPRLGVDRAATVDEAGDVGDGVEEDHVVAVGLEGERLVEVHAPGRVERDEGEVARVDAAGAVLPAHGVAGRPRARRQGRPRGPGTPPGWPRTRPPGGHGRRPRRASPPV